MIDVDIESRLGDFTLDVKFAADAPIVGLFGRSGSGKTSLVNAIAGVAKPRRGTIRVNGDVLFDSEKRIDVPPEHRRVGYVFQDPLLFPHLNVKSNLTYGQRLRPLAGRFIDEQRVVDLLGLRDLLHRKPRALSGGEKQRVAIGRALLAQPRILLMDEPLAALDVSRKVEILEYIERLRDDLAIPIVYVSHSVTEVTRLADTIVLLADGKCVAIGEVEEVMGRAELRSVTGRYEAGSLIEARVRGQDPGNALTILAFDGGELYVPRLDVAVDSRVRVRIRARDVSIATQRPPGISILNVLEGTVASIRTDEGPIADVQVKVGSASVNARVTRRALADLGLREGQAIFALVKAVSFDQRSVGYA